MPVLRIGEASVRFEDEGSGEPILLLHGFPTTRALWKRVAPLLVEAGFRVIAPDLVGYGESSCPRTVEPDMARQSGWMLSLLKLTTGPGTPARSASSASWASYTSQGRTGSAPRTLRS